MATEAQMAALKKARKALAAKQKTGTRSNPSSKQSNTPKAVSVRKETVYDWNEEDLASKRFGGQGTFENEG